jgi:endonuclease/exonuclease/phosphatase family metal-dependent hydrolase
MKSRPGLRRSARVAGRGRAAVVLLAAALLAAATSATSATASTGASTDSATGPSVDAPGAHAPAVPLRVATYNIHAGAGQDQVYDLDRTTRALRDLDADVIGLQEVDVHWSARSDFADEARALAEKLGMRVFFAPIYDMDPATPGGERRQYGVAVLSRFPVLAAENHEITRLSTQVPGSPPAPAPGFAEVTVNVRGAHTHVYVTHLDYRADPSVRAAQVADTRRILAADHGPKILVGDFNAEASAPELAPLWEDLRNATPGVGPTYPAVGPVKQIDFVTVSPDVTVTAAHAVATDASDHRPVVADVELHRRGDGLPRAGRPSHGRPLRTTRRATTRAQAHPAPARSQQARPTPAPCPAPAKPLHVSRPYRRPPPHQPPNAPVGTIRSRTGATAAGSGSRSARRPGVIEPSTLG